MGVPGLTGREQLILELLLEAKTRLYGLELVRASGGRLPRGTVYVTLERMRERGLVEFEIDPDDKSTAGLPRRRFFATGAGKAAYTAWLRYQEAVTSLPNLGTLGA